MKKGYILSILLLSFAGTCAFSQTKNSLKAARNFFKVDQAVKQTLARHVLPKTSQLPSLPTAAACQQVHALMQANQSRISLLRENRVYEDAWSAKDAPKTYTSQNRLGKELSDFYHDVQVPQFRTASGKIGKVYELPVEGIEYAPLGKPSTLLNPQTQVIFYIEGVGTQILDRSLLENPLYFQPVTEVTK